MANSAACCCPSWPELHLPEDQEAVLLLDCWKVHVSADFNAWLKEHYPSLRTLFIYGGGTGDVSHQAWRCIMAHAMLLLHSTRAVHRSQHTLIRSPVFAVPDL